MGLAMECTRLRSYIMSQRVKRVAMTISHSIVAPRYTVPWGVIVSCPDPTPKRRRGSGIASSPGPLSISQLLMLHAKSGRGGPGT
jgi:hypothetical protein